MCNSSAAFVLCVWTRRGQGAEVVLLLLLHADGPVLCCAVRWVIRVGAGAWGHDEMRLAGAQRRIMSMARVALRSVACQRRSMVPLLTLCLGSGVAGAARRRRASIIFNTSACGVATRRPSRSTRQVWRRRRQLWPKDSQASTIVTDNYLARAQVPASHVAWARTHLGAPAFPNPQRCG